MPDLHLDSSALAGFATQLRGLITDHDTTLVTGPTGETGDLEAALEALSASDKACGAGLSDYLTKLAGLADAASQAAEKLDQDLANDVDIPAMHGTWRPHAE